MIVMRRGRCLGEVQTGVFWGHGATCLQVLIKWFRGKKADLYIFMKREGERDRGTNRERESRNAVKCLSETLDEGDIEVLCIVLGMFL